MQQELEDITKKRSNKWRGRQGRVRHRPALLGLARQTDGVGVERRTEVRKRCTATGLSDHGYAELLEK